MNPTASLELQAAEALARLLPAPSELAPRLAVPGEEPSGDTQAVVATFVGQVSAELVVVPHQGVADALAEAGNLSLAEALRPALEAAAEQLGAGVLGPAEMRPAGEVLGSDEMTMVALDADGVTQAWFGMAVRGKNADGAPTAAQQVAQAASAAAAQTMSAGHGAAPAAFPAFNAPSVANTGAAMRVLYDVEMTLTTEIGRTRMPVREVLDLVPGTVLELDRSAGSPADVMVNGRLVARGDVVVVDDEYAVRITEIVSGSDGVI